MFQRIAFATESNRQHPMKTSSPVGRGMFERVAMRYRNLSGVAEVVYSSYVQFP